MIHTSTSLESLADRFIFASKMNLHGQLLAMAEELADARAQCERITGGSWVYFWIDRQAQLQKEEK